METSLLFPAEFQVLRATVSQRGVDLELTFTPFIGYCPLCHTPSSRIHSYYHRRLKELPMCGKPVKISLWVRKFFCDQAGCPRKIFVQQADLVLKLHARRLQGVDVQVQMMVYWLAASQEPGSVSRRAYP